MQETLAAMPPLSPAVSLLQAGDAAGAREFLIRHSEASAQHAFLLGACAHALDQIEEAIRSFTCALQRNPAHAPAASALGSLYAGLGRHQEAEALFRQSLTRVDDAQLRFNLAVILENTGRPAEALNEYSELIRRGEHYGARHNRAGLLVRDNRLSEAAEDYRVLVQHQPRHTRPWQSLGELELGLGHYEAAIALLNTVLQREPENGKAMFSLAIALAANGEIDSSRKIFSRLHSVDNARWAEARARLNHLRGHDAGIDPRLIFLLRQQEHLRACNWRHWPLYGDIFSDFIRNPGNGETTGLAYISMGAPINAQEQQLLARHIGAQIQRRTRAFLHAASAAPQRLRVAYAATRFGHHVTGLLFRHFFAAHDLQAVDVFILSLGPDDASTNIKTIRNTPGINWVDLSLVSDEEAASRIKALNLDIVVDLAVYNDKPRPEVLASRPAPIQVSWQGAAYSSGAPWIDYVISDAIVSPGPDWCSEAEVTLPGCYFVCSTEDAPPVVPVRESLGLPADKFVFACLNICSKIEPEIFSCWMRILKAAPDSVLWLLASSTAHIMNLRREAEWRGIDPQRLLFASRVTPAEHIARQGAADLFLDTRYFNGHTTTAESLWAGTPALTCPGATFASRVGASLVRSCKLDELVVSSWQHYEEKALELYRDREQLAALRRRLVETRTQAPSFNMKQQATHMEKAYRHMRERFAQGLAPAAFRVADLEN
ncbi:MAG: tetratricopeptide repeat protein [bacterium]|nr:tetratricopeptide repeat protein [bacterium]